MEETMYCDSGLHVAVWSKPPVCIRAGLLNLSDIYGLEASITENTRLRDD